LEVRIAVRGSAYGDKDGAIAVDLPGDVERPSSAGGDRDLAAAGWLKLPNRVLVGRVGKRLLDRGKTRPIVLLDDWLMMVYLAGIGLSGHPAAPPLERALRKSVTYAQK